MTVAVIDTGVDTSHPDLSKALDVGRSRSFRFGESLEDHSGHGTHIAGIIAGSGARNHLYRGIAPGASIVALAALHADGAGDSSAIAEAIVYAASIGAEIINLSLGSNAEDVGGGPGPWIWSDKLTTVEVAVQHATKLGSLCVCAAGNCGPFPGTVELPGATAEALCIGALNREGDVADFSARGPFYRSPDVALGVVRSDGEPGIPAVPYVKPDLVLPGGGDSSGRRDILGHLRVDRAGIVAPRSKSSPLRRASPLDSDRFYGRISGTSQSAAVGSGMAALTLQYCRVKGLDLGKHPNIALANILRASASRDGLGNDTLCGKGRLVWARIKDQVNACLENHRLRESVLGGEAPKLL